MARKTWLGGVPSVFERIKHELSGSYATGDELSLTNGKAKIALEVGSTATAAEAAKTLAILVNSGSLSSDERWLTPGGQSVGQWAGTLAWSSGSDLYIQGPTGGRPFDTNDPVFSSSGLGVTNRVSDVTSEGGPDGKEADNWSGGALPATSGDDAIFNHEASAGVLYGVDFSGTTFGRVDITRGFEYEIGLDPVNSDNASLPYSEHLGTWLRIKCSTLNIGEFQGNGSGRLRLSVESAPTINVYATGERKNAKLPALMLKGMTGGTVNIFGGDVGICLEEGDTATVANLNVFNGATPRIGTGLTISGGARFW